MAPGKSRQPDAGAAGSEYAEALEQATRGLLEETVKNLPEKCQLVFRLSREAGLSESEIAAELGISLKTVGAHKTKALKALRKALHQFLFSWLF